MKKTIQRSAAIFFLSFVLLCKAIAQNDPGIDREHMADSAYAFASVPKVASTINLCPKQENFGVVAAFNKYYYGCQPNDFILTTLKRKELLLLISRITVASK